MTHRISWRALALACIPLLLAACSNTKVIGGWADPTYGPKPMKKMLVVGVTHDETGQRLFESTFTWALAERGVESIAAHAKFPAGTKLEKSDVDALVEELGIDGILVTRKVKVSERETYIPGENYAIGSPYYGYGGFYPYYSASYTVVSTPGHFETEKVIQVESNLYAASSGELVWTTRSETVDPSGLDTAIEGVCGVMIDELRDHDFVP